MGLFSHSKIGFVKELEIGKPSRNLNESPWTNLPSQKGTGLKIHTPKVQLPRQCALASSTRWNFPKNS